MEDVEHFFVAPVVINNEEVVTTDPVDSVPEVVESNPEAVESIPEVVESNPEVVESNPEVVESNPEVIELCSVGTNEINQNITADAVDSVSEVIELCAVESNEINQNISVDAVDSVAEVIELCSVETNEINQNVSVDAVDSVSEVIELCAVEADESDRNAVAVENSAAESKKSCKRNIDDVNDCLNDPLESKASTSKKKVKEPLESECSNSKRKVVKKEKGGPKSKKKAIAISDSANKRRKVGSPNENTASDSVSTEPDPIQSLIDEVTCPYCLKKCVSKVSKKRHIRYIHQMVNGHQVEPPQYVSEADMTDMTEEDKSICPYCRKKASTACNMRRHVRRIHNIVIVTERRKYNRNTDSGQDLMDIVSLACPYCHEEYNTVLDKIEHVRNVHNIVIDRNKYYMRCIECDIPAGSTASLRRHLASVHNQDMSEEELTFPNMDAFLKWKHLVERQTLSSYTLRHGTKCHANGPAMTYSCHRSGKYQAKTTGAKRRRMIRTQGSCKLGIACTASMYVQEMANEVKVRYCPHHYGHGKDSCFLQLSAQEQTAIQENVSNGVSFESMLDDIRDSVSDKDSFQLLLLKKKDMRFINAAFQSEDYVPRMNDAESVEHWVSNCCQMEDSPILFYRPEDPTGEDCFMLTIMTEFQKHILINSSKNVVCVDSLFRKKGSRFYLTIIFIMDEFDNAFPVAFCISSKIDKAVITQFFESVRESTGPLQADFLMSDNDPFFYEAWREVMEDNSQWLWSMWWVDSRIRTQLKCVKGQIQKRSEIYSGMRNLLECQNQNVFHSMFKNFLDMLSDDPQTAKMRTFVESRYGDNYEMWAYCYRKQLNLSTNIHLEGMHRTFRFLCREGRKKRLDKFIFVLMKLVRNKMLDRLTNMMDEDKTQLAIEAINMCHSIGMDIPSEHIASLSSKVWLVKTEEDDGDIYVTRDFDSCPEHCNLRCSPCDICVHMFSCSCLLSMINANLCQHIHGVVWKFLTPHFSPPPSPGMPDYESADESAPSTPAHFKSECSTLLGNVLKKTHAVYQMVKDSKCTLTKDSLSLIMDKLNDCMDLGTGKVVPVKKEVTSPTTSADNTPVYVLNPFAQNKPSQPIILPNYYQGPQPNNGAFNFVQGHPLNNPGYMIVLPSSNTQQN